MLPSFKPDPNAKPAEPGSDFVVKVALSWGVTFALVTVLLMESSNFATGTIIAILSGTGGGLLGAIGARILNASPPA